MAVGAYHKITMKQEDKTLAETILKDLCSGRRICGVNFYAMPILLIDSIEANSSKPQTALTIENGWSTFNGIPDTWESFDFPKKAMGQERISELIATVGTLGWYEIVDVQLGQNIPHLMLRFKNGQTFLVNGHDDQYESWNLAAGKILVVATPGDELSIWSPDNYK